MNADINGDWLVGTDDLLAVLAAWGPCPKCSEDLDNDGQVDTDEVLLILSEWGVCF